MQQTHIVCTGNILRYNQYYAHVASLMPLMTGAFKDDYNVILM